MPEGLASSQPNQGTEILPSGTLTGLAHPKLLGTITKYNRLIGQAGWFEK